MMHRREVYRWGTVVLSGLIALGLAVPGVAYVCSPLLSRKGKQQGAGEDQDDGFRPLALLGDLEENRPRAFPIVDERQDAWVKYPREPIGTVWLMLRSGGESPRVLAFSAECPHLGCAVNLSADGQEYLCPCHSSAFRLSDGAPTNNVPPRGLDPLEIRVEGEEIQVRYQRFRSQTKERIPVA